MKKFGYKLFRVRRDGTLGSLFINKRQVVIPNIWLQAKCYPTKGFKVRPGFHVCPQPSAPHLKTNPKHGKRVWMKVEMLGYREEMRPQAQGGLWFLADHIRVVA